MVCGVSHGLENTPELMESSQNVRNISVQIFGTYKSRIYKRTEVTSDTVGTLSKFKIINQ